MITVVFAQWHGTDALELTYKTNAGALGQQVIFRKDQDKPVAQTGSRAFDANASDFTRSESSASRLPGYLTRCSRSPPATSVRCPIRSAPSTESFSPALRCGSCSPTTPAPARRSWPGSTSRNCCLRDDVRQCLIVAPGGLVEQWQDELFFKFGLRFDLLTNQLIDANVNHNVFDTHPLLIARMDQLSRNPELQAQLKETEWDLIIVDFSSCPRCATRTSTRGNAAVSHTSTVLFTTPDEGD